METLNGEKINHLPDYEVKRLALSDKLILVSQVGVNILFKQKEDIASDEKRTLEELGIVAREDSDLPETTQFKELKTRLQFEIPRRKKDLRDVFTKAVKYVETQDGSVRFGTKFRAIIKYPYESETGNFVLLGPIEAANKKIDDDGSTIISYKSPVGRNVWGVKPDTEVEFKIPDGKARIIVTDIFPKG